MKANRHFALRIQQVFGGLVYVSSLRFPAIDYFHRIAVLP